MKENYEICPTCNGAGQYWGGEDVYVCWECKGDTVVKYEKLKLSFLGREMGTYSGWDQLETASLCFYDPIIEGMPEGTTILNVLFDNGIYEYINDDGDVLETGDLLDLVNGKPLTNELYDMKAQ